MVELPPEQSLGGIHPCSFQATSEPMSAGVPAMAIVAAAAARGGSCEPAFP